MIFGNADPGWCSSGSAICKGVLQLEATLINVTNIYLHQDSNLGLWNTLPIHWDWSPSLWNTSRWRDMFFTSIKFASSLRMLLQVAPEVLTETSIAK